VNLLNLGCGDIFHPAWKNIDIQSQSEHVQACDLRRGLPFGSETFDVVYHSHVFEHLRPSETSPFLTEIKRVLKQGGIMRVVVPDLERIVQIYLEKLKSAEEGGTTSDYDWMVIELLDQLTRENSGGQMRQFLLDPNLKNREFILNRIGFEAEKIWSAQKKSGQSFFQKLKTKDLSFLVNKIRYKIICFFLMLTGSRELRLAFELGYFRRSGEIHQWMYDRFSLKRVLEKNGFRDIKIMKADTSDIPEFNSFELDIRNGKIRKPDSLFLECRKS
jgi:predicted SAM-dependent methyltransferase